jgi:signal transduction histidine kinase
VSGEVDLALARARTPEAYRDTLERIGERVAELVDLTADFALLGDTRRAVVSPDRSVPLHALFAGLADRYGPRRGSPVAFDVAQSDRRVTGDEASLGGALALLLEHAVRHRRDGARVRLRALASEGSPRLVLDAPPAGFATGTWQALADRAHGDALAHGHLRLDTAARIVRACGGSIAAAFDSGRECVRISLGLPDAGSRKEEAP